MTVLADLAEGLGVGRDDDRLLGAVERGLVEPLGDRRAVSQFVDVGAAVALAGRVLVAHPGAEVGEQKVGLADLFQLGLERLADVPQDHEAFAVGERDQGLVRESS